MVTPITAPEGTPSTPLPKAAPVRAGGEVFIIFKHEWRHLLLSVRTLLPMLIYAGFGGLAMASFIFIANKAKAEFDTNVATAGVEANFDEQTSQLLGKILDTANWGTEGDAAEMLRDKVPLLVIFFFAVASYFLPLLVAIVSFDQFSELSTRGARFALLRVRRTTYFLGKALAALGAVGAFLLAMWVVVVAVAALRGEPADVPHALREGLRAWGLMTILAIPYLGLTALISSLARPGLAFLGIFGTFIAMSVGSTVLLFLSNSKTEWLATVAGGLLQVFPWTHAPKLISRDLGTLFSGVGALVLIGIIGYLLALAVVRRRDV